MWGLAKIAIPIVHPLCNEILDYEKHFVVMLVQISSGGVMKKRIVLLLVMVFQKCDAEFADNILPTLTLDEKIGQLFIISSSAKILEKNVVDAIRKYHVGNILLGFGTLESCFKIINQLQSMSKIPLIISIDGEWGLNLRLSNALCFPKNLTLGALEDDSLIYELGKEIGKQFKLIGVNLNFAPVVDINSNPCNPVGGERSFGDDKERVAKKAVLFMKGLQDNGIIACAKHFPGHGDTSVDSHKKLPLIKHSLSRIKEVELYPFKKMIEAGVKAVMSAHICVPAIDDRLNRPITLSKKGMFDLLQTNLKFSGLVITDSLVMKAITNHYLPGEAELEAFLAGNDLLMITINTLPNAIRLIKNAIRKGIITNREFDKRVLKILQAKEWLRLHEYDQHKYFNIADFNTSYSRKLKRKIYEYAITLAKNNINSIPLKNIHKKIASLQISSKPQRHYQQKLIQFNPGMQSFMLNPNATKSECISMYNQLKNFDKTIVGIFDLNNFYQENYGLSNNILNFLNDLNINNDVILSIFGTPYCLKFFEHFDSVIVAYENCKNTQKGTVKIITGELNARGKLPISNYS